MKLGDMVRVTGYGVMPDPSIFEGKVVEISGVVVKVRGKSICDCCINHASNQERDEIFWNDDRLVKITELT